ncbi:extracellular solute-binding protein [Pseudobacteroides cellulosolvens]|uniref:Extracellular solute-binding protein family 1 n=1 Tax=Pseudobacteroides cellulosolvens ATCC 35603 = DSM 2933 TaxID=398512 RepID=A0A0L6JH92_9FIRM|nr:extracellular solute-binding protein [Pseudobacteroides cellulosolvens]KNY25196.1 extracellular solute-binding protein family 1 [Pseudobacteroides cellulosolvens ATCC 35603 = DSM 2933]
MKKFFSKAICFTIMLMLLSSTVGCGSGTSNEGDNGAKVNDSTEQDVSKKNKGPQVELKVAVFDRGTKGYVADNNFQTKWIQEKFGDPNNIKVTFVPIPRAQEVDKLKVLMASNQAPDICFTYTDSVVVDFAKNGGLTDLTELIDKNAPNLKKFLGEDLLSYGRWDNIQYAVPAKRVMVAAESTFIRKDWLDKVGLPVPKTTDEFYNAMKAFKEKDPGKLGGKVIPYTFAVDPNNLMWGVSPLLDSFKEKISEEDTYSLPNWLVPGFKEGMRFLNKMYNEGLLDPKFATDDGKHNDDNISKGLAGAFIHTFDLTYRAGSFSDKIKTVAPEGQYIPIDPFVNKEGKHLKFKFNPNGLFIIVPKTSQRAAEAIKYLEWMADPEVLFYLQNGEKGVHYLDEKNGIPVNIIPNDKLADDNKANFIDLSIIVNGKEFGSEDKNVEAASYGFPGYEELYKQAYSAAMNDASFMPHLDRAIESKAKYSKVLGEKEVETFIKTITCKPAEFDKTYDTLIQEYLKAGGQQVIDETRAAYKAMKK